LPKNEKLKEANRRWNAIKNTPEGRECKEAAETVKEIEDMGPKEKEQLANKISGKIEKLVT
jgi:hypothetical protein